MSEYQLKQIPRGDAPCHGCLWQREPLRLGWCWLHPLKYRGNRTKRQMHEMLGCENQEFYRVVLVHKLTDEVVDPIQVMELYN